VLGQSIFTKPYVARLHADNFNFHETSAKLTLECFGFNDRYYELRNTRTYKSVSIEKYQKYIDDVRDN